MKLAVDEGGCGYSKVNGYSMGGKTGTAQKIPRADGKYLVSFIGFAPYENPQLVLYVVVDEIVKRGLEDQAIILAPHINQLKAVHELNPNIEL